MEITLFSQCIKDLIVENDKIDVPYLGTFRAEMMPATYSDRQTTIHPPYRKMSFHKGEVSLEDGRILLEKVVEETGVSLDQAGVELGWCLSRLSSELEGSKSCKLPGLGVMRANARNEFFFVPDDDLDIWPDGLGFEPISIKVSRKAEQIEQEEPVDQVDQVEQVAPSPSVDSGDREEEPEKPEPQREMPDQLGNEEVRLGQGDDEPGEPEEQQINLLKVVLIALAVLLVLFIAASYLFTDQMSPILDWLLYTKEERMLLGR